MSAELNGELNTSNPAVPTYVRPEVAASRPDLDLMEHLLAGTRRMWKEAKLRNYIRKWSDETEEVFTIRSRGEVLFEGLRRTLSASIGMLYAKPPTLDFGAAKEQLTEHWENIDAQGTHGDVFTKRYSEKALSDGFAVLVVDVPPMALDPDKNPITITAANEKALGIRPTWAIYARNQVLSWRTSIINQRNTITQLVLYEGGASDVGTYGVKPVHRYRVLRIVNGAAAWTLIEQTKDNANNVDSFTVIGAGFFRNRFGETTDRLPIAVGYTGPTHAPLTADLPLLGVAWANLAHWQLSTDRRFYLGLCAYPQPVVLGALAAQSGIDATGAQGLVPGKLRLGPMVAIHLTADQRGTPADFKFAELSGTSIERLEHAINEKLQHMAALGVAFLTVETRAAETAEAKRIDSVAQNATLSTASRGIEDSVNEALRWHAWYLGVTEVDQAPAYAMNRDFENEVLDSATMLAYVTAVQNAGLPIRLLLQAWQLGGRIGEEIDLEDLEREMIAAKAADDEAKRQAAVDAASAQGSGPGASGTPPGSKAE